MVVLRLGVLAALCAGCFSPPASDCSLSCGSEGACPSGYTCLGDRMCHERPDEELCPVLNEPPADARPDAAGAPDAAPGAPDAPPPVDAPPVQTFVLDDPLTTAASFAFPLGGTFTARGWRVDARTDRLWYQVPVLVSGFLEVTVEDMRNDGSSNMILEDHELLSMYEAGYTIAEPIPYFSEFRNNNYKVMVRVDGDASTTSGRQELVWVNCPDGAPGFHQDGQPCACGNSFVGDIPTVGDPTWNGSPQRLRVEWNQTGARLFRNGTLVMSHVWPDTARFGPTVLHISLGSARATAIAQAGLPVGAIFSDLHVEGVVGTPMTSCL